MKQDKKRMSVNRMKQDKKRMLVNRMKQDKKRMLVHVNRMIVLATGIKCKKMFTSIAP